MYEHVNGASRMNGASWRARSLSLDLFLAALFSAFGGIDAFCKELHNE